MKIKGKRIKAEIPTSSQSDIAFLLIIFFLITTSFAVRTGLSVEYPSQDTAPKEIEKEKVGRIYISSELIKIGEDQTSDIHEFEKLLNQFPFQQIIVEVEEGTLYGKVAEVLGILQGKPLEINLRMAE